MLLGDSWYLLASKSYPPGGTTAFWAPFLILTATNVFLIALDVVWRRQGPSRGNS